MTSSALVLVGGLLPATRPGLLVDAVWALGFTAIGGALVHRGRFGRLALACLVGVLGAVAFTAERYASAAVERGWPAAEWSAWIAQWAWAPAVLLPLTVILLLVPDDRALPRLEPLVRVSSALVATTTVVLALLPATNDNGLINPVAQLPDDPQYLLGPLLGLLTATCVLALGGLVVKLHRAHGAARLQLSWVTAGAFVLVVGTVGNPLLPGPWSPLVEVLAAAALPSAIGVAMLRHRLWDTDALLRRSLVYGLTLLLLGTGFLLSAAAVGAFVAGGSAWWAAVLAAGFTLLFGPARRRLALVVDRWLYGRRGDPVGALQTLAQALAESAEPEKVLAATADAVRHSLGAQGVQLVGVVDDEDLISVSSAETSGHGAVCSPHVVELEQAGTLVGRLEVIPRAGESALDERDLRVLEHLNAVALAVVSAAVRQIHLQLARQDLVQAREEERLLLRRDLHDGLGPVLAGMGFTTDAARNRLPPDATAVDELLLKMRGLVAEAVTNVRRITRGLRPASLDELGLRGSLEAVAETLGRAGLAVELDLRGPVDRLSPAVEVACHAIATEALTNVARHASASTCLVVVDAGTTACRVEVHDDGVGIAPETPPGVGLSSMRQRAQELGGTFSCTYDEGTHVVVHIPTEED